ncbi:ADP-ribose glycohydrolase OARD1-like [Aphis gossypii]|uniref:ADP-ribose glycohydrolase OARD1-like n=1 Tax=Aphis gossypii TaxID=80765 RepID=UPI002158ED83|nr:ADP-ribose glycohydrolase OARD1-like [Aphis gossypii]
MFPANYIPYQQQQPYQQLQQQHMFNGNNRKIKIRPPRKLQQRNRFMTPTYEPEAEKQENITKKSHNQGTRLVEINSCILDMPREFSIGHCVAKDMRMKLRMSAGIAIYFKNTYKRVGELMDQRKDVGCVVVLEENQRFIFYLITKELSNHKPTYDNITATIKTLHALVVEHGIKKLALPRIGCGLDNLNWTRVIEIIENEFQNGECTITICHFTKHLSKESDVIRVEHPTTIKIDKNIKNIEKREHEKFCIILYFRNTTLPVYWDQ